jgi:hypothetical protein
MDFDEVSSIYSNKYIFVTKDLKSNILTIEGELLCDEWYDNIKRQYSINEMEPFIVIEKNGGKSLFNVLTRKPLNVWGDYIENFQYGENETIIGRDGKENLVNKDGNFLFSEWVDGIKKCGVFDCYIIEKHNKSNLWRNNKFLFDEWYDSITYNSPFICINDEHYLDIIEILYGGRLE